MENQILPLERFGDTIVEQSQPYKVLVRVDSAGRLVDINSSAFVTDTGGWTEVLLP